jgi:hypothetical protein
MTAKRFFPGRLQFCIGCVLVSSLLLVSLLNSQARADGGTVIARAQLRRTTDPSPRAAFGTVLMTIDTTGLETFQVNVAKLGEDNFGLFVREEPTPTTNIVPTLALPPLDRTSVKDGNWSRTLIGTNQAPVDFLPVFGHLTDLNPNSIDVAQPNIPFVTTIVTNIIAGVTNIFMGVTNIVGSTTNIINGIVIPNPGQTGLVFSALWAPLNGLTAKPSMLSYHRRGKLFPVGDASPNATGTVNIRFDGNTGRSVFKVRAANLTRGQQYTLFVANSTNLDTTVMIPVDNMTQTNLGSTATFVRDTRFADPLPQQARDIGDLSGRLVQIRDAFEVVHLQGLMP